MQLISPCSPDSSLALTSTDCGPEYHLLSPSVLSTLTNGPEHSTSIVAPVVEDTMSAGLLADAVGVYLPAGSPPGSHGSRLSTADGEPVVHGVPLLEPKFGVTSSLA